MNDQQLQHEIAEVSKLLKPNLEGEKLLFNGVHCFDVQGHLEPCGNWVFSLTFNLHDWIEHVGSYVTEQSLIEDATEHLAAYLIRSRTLLKSLNLPL